ncbi:uncharacterized protein BDR25DRAFT_160292, partial [Lindgomyces ingoldianus]
DSCIEFGKQVMQAEDLEPVHNQGCNSFTLVCHRKQKIVQFRLKPFDALIMDLAHQIYGTMTVIDLGQFVARSTHFSQPKTSYRADSWTMMSKKTLNRLHHNSSLQAAPEIAEIVSLNILVDDAGDVTGVIDFDTAFWDSLWSNVSQELKEKREELDAAIRMALSIGVINRYFIRGMMDKVDESIKVHRLSL